MKIYRTNLDPSPQRDMEAIFAVLDRDLKIVMSDRGAGTSSLGGEGIWAKRLPKWIKKIVKNSSIDRDEINSFVGHNILLSEMPSRAKGWLFNGLKQLIRGPGYWQTCFSNFKKLESLGYGVKFKDYKLSMVGNPYFYEIDGFKFNERFLRHVRTVDLFMEHIRSRDNDKLVVLDIGGGYSQFAYMLGKAAKMTVSATLDFKEQLLLSYYFLKSNDPSLRVNSLEEILELDRIDSSFIDKFDVILIPVECFEKLDAGLFDVVCNFSSLGEMSDEAFKKYITSDVLSQAKYFFTVNRLDSWPTYDNSISVIDYPLCKFDTLHKGISPIWDYYYRSITKFFMKKVPYSSRNFEFIGINKARR
jgi:putative sugar O-methyltransferase